MVLSSPWSSLSPARRRIARRHALLNIYRSYPQPRPALSFPGRVAPSSTTTPPTPPVDPYADLSTLYSPLYASLAAQRARDEAQARAEAQATVAGVTSAYAWGTPIMQQGYDTAINQTQALNKEIADRLQTEGGANQADLTAKLTQIGASAPSNAVSETGPTVAPAEQNVAGTVANTYQGAQGSGFALNSTDINRLLGRKSEQTAYFSGAPGRAAAQAHSELAQSLLGISKDYADQLFGLQSEEAGKKFDISQNIKAQAYQKQQDSLNQYWDNYWKKQDLLERRWEIQVASGDRRAADRTRQVIAANSAQAKIDAANIAAGATEASATTRAAATTAAATTRAAATSANKAPKNGPSKASQMARNFRGTPFKTVTVTDAQGNKHIKTVRNKPKVSYGSAYTSIENQLESMGYPPDAAAALARQAVNTAYGPGVGGRPGKIRGAPIVP